MELYYINKPKLENFETNIDYTKTKSFESNTSVNTDLIIKSINNIVNKSKNDVLQNNTAAVSALASAINEISFLNNKADVLSINGVNMGNEAELDVTVDTKQSSINDVSESFNESLKNEINNEVNNNKITLLLIDS